MTYKEFNSRLFERFPHLKTMSDKEFDYFGDDEPGCYLVFEGLLVPEIERAATTDRNYLRALMNFVEEVASSSDNHCRDLVGIGLGEWLPSAASAEVIRSAAGPATLRCL